MFQLDDPNAGTNGNAVAGYANVCQKDYVIIVEGGAHTPTAINTENHNRFCGGLLGTGTQIGTAATAQVWGPGLTYPAAASTVYSRFVPFQVGFVTDGHERESYPSNTQTDADILSKGFNIYYSQVAC